MGILNGSHSCEFLITVPGFPSPVARAFVPCVLSWHPHIFPLLTVEGHVHPSAPSPGVLSSLCKRQLGYVCYAAGATFHPQPARLALSK